MFSDWLGKYMFLKDKCFYSQEFLLTKDPCSPLNIADILFVSIVVQKLALLFAYCCLFYTCLLHKSQLTMIFVLEGV